MKTLSDGGLTHRIIESPSWWLQKLIPHFMIINSDVRLEEAVLVVSGIPKESEAAFMKTWADATAEQRKKMEENLGEAA